MTFIKNYLNQFHIETIAFDLFSKVISLSLLFLIFIICKQLINRFFDKGFSKSPFVSYQTEARQKTIVKLTHNIVNYTLYFFLFYWILSILGIPVSSLLAGAGIAGITVGLGAQGFLSDVVNGFFILLENQFEVGDSVTIGTISGTIVSVGIRTTQIKGSDGSLNFLPNRSITIVTNKSRGNMRAQIDLPLSTNTNLDEVNRIIGEINEEHVSQYPSIIGKPKIIGPQILSNGQFVFRIDIFVKNGHQNDIYATFYKLYQDSLLSNDILLHDKVTP